MSDCRRDLYIGRTHVGKIRRHKEHTIYDKKSAVYQRIDEDEGHGFDIQDVEIEVCCDHNKLKILESLYIKEYLLDERILKGKEGMLNKKRGKVLSLFADTGDEKERANYKLNPGIEE